MFLVDVDLDREIAGLVNGRGLLDWIGLDWSAVQCGCGRDMANAIDWMWVETPNFTEL